MTGTASRLMALATALAIPVAWNAEAAEAANGDTFCKQIQAIVADAPNSFAAFRGERTSQEISAVPPPITVDHYAANGTPDGATACEITARDTATDAGNYLPNYSCDFPIAGTNKGAATLKLAKRVTACLPGISRPTGPGLDKDGGLLDAHSNDYSLSYTFISGPAKQTITLLIQNNWK